MKFLVPDATQHGEERAPGLAGLHGAIRRICLVGVFGYGLNREFTQPHLQPEGGKVKSIVLLLGEIGGGLGSWDEWKAHIVQFFREILESRGGRGSDNHGCTRIGTDGGCGGEALKELKRLKR